MTFLKSGYSVLIVRDVPPVACKDREVCGSIGSRMFTVTQRLGRALGGSEKRSKVSQVTLHCTQNCGAMQLAFLKSGPI